MIRKKTVELKAPRATDPRPWKNRMAAAATLRPE
jgi:hypothetical protein